MGTGLRILAQPTSEETLVVPDSDDDALTKLEKTITQFGEAPIQGKLPPPSAGLATAWKNIYLGKPIDRLAPELRKQYQRLIKSKKGVLFEVEIITYETGARKQRSDLESSVLQLGNTLANEGAIYEADYGECGVRVCLWASGKKFRELVEGEDWQRKISFFEARPQFETYHSALTNFRFGDLGPITPPQENAPIICIVDSGVAPGNPFLAPVVKKELCKSYLAGATNQPWDELGHGSGVASLAAYYALSINKGATNEAKAWIASARILNAEGMMDKGTGDIESDRVAEAKLLSLTLKTIVKDFTNAGVRIFVLAFTIKNRLWNQDGKQLVPRASWLARTLDQLSRKHGVVFVTITGNASEGAVASLHAKRQLSGISARRRNEDRGSCAKRVVLNSRLYCPFRDCTIAQNGPHRQDRRAISIHQVWPGFRRGNQTRCGRTRREFCLRSAPQARGQEPPYRDIDGQWQYNSGDRSRGRY